VPNTPNPISAIQPPTSKGRPRPETGRRGLPLLREDKSAGIEGYARWWLNALLSGRSGDWKGERSGRSPFRAVATATPSRKTNHKQLSKDKCISHILTCLIW